VRIPAAVKPITAKPRGRRLYAVDVAAGLYVGYLSRKYPGSLKTASYILPRFIAFLRRSRVRDIRRVTRDHIAGYLRHLATVKTQRRRTPFTEASRVVYATNVRRLFRYLYKQNLVLMNPTSDLVLPKVNRLPRVVPTEAQARRIVSAPSADTLIGRRDRAILETFYGSGIRAKECRGLDLRDIDLSRFILTVRLGKGGKDRVVPISGRAAVALDLYLREVRPEFLKNPGEQALFLSWNTGGRLKQTGMQQVVVRAAHAAGVPVRMAPHALRHACALHLLRGGADIRHVQALLGHSSIGTTAVYTRLDMRDLKHVVERSHPREKASEKPAPEPAGRQPPRMEGKMERKWRPRRSRSNTRTS
jgi:site-specific recombinase XerD